MLSKGLAYEAKAQRYLESSGLKLVSKNYRTKLGEIDLIMKHHDTVVFIEVRYRNDARFGSGVETITKSKQRKIIRSAQQFLNENKLWHLNSRFDVVSISPKTRTKSLNIDWIKSAFLSDD